MSIFSNKQKAEYTHTLQKGISFVRGLCGGITDDTGTREENLRRLKDEIENADAIVIGAGAGLSTAAGFTYSGVTKQYVRSRYGRDRSASMETAVKC